MDVYMTKPDGTYSTIKITELLPHGFTPAQLEEEKMSPNS